eukprot:Rmarinus@m.19428
MSESDGFDTFTSFLDSFWGEKPRVNERNQASLRAGESQFISQYNGPCMPQSTKHPGDPVFEPRTRCNEVSTEPNPEHRPTAETSMMQESLQSVSPIFTSPASTSGKLPEKEKDAMSKFSSFLDSLWDDGQSQGRNRPTKPSLISQSPSMTPRETTVSTKSSTTSSGPLSLVAGRTSSYSPNVGPMSSSGSTRILPPRSPSVHEINAQHHVSSYYNISSPKGVQIASNSTSTFVPRKRKHADVFSLEKWLQESSRGSTLGLADKWDEGLRAIVRSVDGSADIGQGINLAIPAWTSARGPSSFFSSETASLVRESAQRHWHPAGPQVQPKGAFSSCSPSRATGPDMIQSPIKPWRLERMHKKAKCVEVAAPVLRYHPHPHLPSSRHVPASNVSSSVGGRSSVDAGHMSSESSVAASIIIDETWLEQTADEFLVGIGLSDMNVKDLAYSLSIDDLASPSPEMESDSSSTVFTFLGSSQQDLVTVILDTVLGPCTDGIVLLPKLMNSRLHLSGEFWEDAVTEANSFSEEDAECDDNNLDPYGAYKGYFSQFHDQDDTRFGVITVHSTSDWETHCETSDSQGEVPVKATVLAASTTDTKAAGHSNDCMFVVEEPATEFSRDTDDMRKTVVHLRPSINEDDAPSGVDVAAETAVVMQGDAAEGRTLPGSSLLCARREEHCGPINEGLAEPHESSNSQNFRGTDRQGILDSSASVDTVDGLHHIPSEDPCEWTDTRPRIGAFSQHDSGSDLSDPVAQSFSTESRSAVDERVATTTMSVAYPSEPTVAEEVAVSDLSSRKREEASAAPLKNDDLVHGTMRRSPPIHNLPDSWLEFSLDNLPEPTEDYDLARIGKPLPLPTLTLAEIVALPANQVCGDCGEPRPQWCSLSNAVFVCIACAGVHRRSLGTSTSAVRSVSLDMWSEEQVQLLRCSLGNESLWNYLHRHSTKLPSPCQSYVTPPEAAKYLSSETKNGTAKPAGDRTVFRSLITSKYMSQPMETYRSLLRKKVRMNLTFGEVKSIAAPQTDASGNQECNQDENIAYHRGQDAIASAKEPRGASTSADAIDRPAETESTTATDRDGSGVVANVASPSPNQATMPGHEGLHTEDDVVFRNVTKDRDTLHSGHESLDDEGDDNDDCRSEPCADFSESVSGDGMYNTEGEASIPTELLLELRDPPPPGAENTHCPTCRKEISGRRDSTGSIVTEKRPSLGSRLSSLFPGSSMAAQTHSCQEESSPDVGASSRPAKKDPVSDNALRSTMGASDRRNSGGSTFSFDLLGFGKPRFCAYTGLYYCKGCHANDKHVIPARIILKWDFKQYPVCRWAKDMLAAVHTQPVLDITVVNSQLYEAVPALYDLQNLRLQLFLMRHYILSCPEKERLLGWLGGREHLMMDTECYSLQDLCDVPGGVLASSLRRIVAEFTYHVTECVYCSAKGFCCELCDNRKPIFPFQMLNTTQCGGCSTLFHRECANDALKASNGNGITCPKCERIARVRSKAGTENRLLQKPSGASLERMERGLAMASSNVLRAEPSLI